MIVLEYLFARERKQKLDDVTIFRNITSPCHFLGELKYFGVPGCKAEGVSKLEPS